MKFTHLTKIVFFALAGLLSLSGECNQIGFDVNDVSILFPLKNGHPHPVIGLDDDNFELIDHEVFEQILKFENPEKELKDLPYINADFISDWSRWFVTSFRVDDCGDLFKATPIRDPLNQQTLAMLVHQPGCQARLRVVVQPFNFSDQPLPTAMHLLFKLSSSQLPQILTQLREIKRQSQLHVNIDGQPLQIHPGLKYESQSNNSNIGLLIYDLFKSIKPIKAQLDILTLTLSVNTMNWKMVGGYVNNNQWHRFVTEFNSRFYDPSGNENIQLGVEEIICNFYEFCATLPKLVPQSFIADNLLTPALSANPAGRLQAPIKNDTTELVAERIESVRSTHFSNTNCLSCHVSTSFRNRDRLRIHEELPVGLSPFTLKDYASEKPSMIINFGYEGLNANISIRTANETIAVADRINRFLNLENPAPRIQNLSKFWNCLMAGSSYLDCFIKN